MCDWLCLQLVFLACTSLQFLICCFVITALVNIVFLSNKTKWVLYFENSLQKRDLLSEVLDLSQTKGHCKYNPYALTETQELV